MLELLFANVPKDAFIVGRSISGGINPHGKYTQDLAALYKWVKKESERTDTEKLAIYYSPTFRRKAEKSNKESVVATNVLWVDYDNPDLPAPNTFLLPPTFTVSSGYGYHLYWLLEEQLADIDLLSTLLKKLCKAYDGDVACAIPESLLRVPGTQNKKYETPQEVRLVAYTEIAYPINDVITALAADWREWCNDANTYIKEGERSEYEFKLAKYLAQLNLSDDVIKACIKFHSPSTSRFNEEDQEHYIEHTVTKVVQQASNPITDIVQGAECYFTMSKEGYPVPLSNFLYKLKAIQQTNNGKSDAFIVDIIANNQTWHNQVLPGTIFSTAAKFCEALPYVHLSWFGGDSQVRKLKKLLSDTWLNEGLPTIKTYSQVGRSPDAKHYITNEQVYNNALVPVDDTIFVAPGFAHPQINLYAPKPLDKEFIETLLTINDRDTVQAMLGWFVACHLKTVLAKYSIRFPHLIVSGSRGAGKTTLITRIFQPLMGYTSAQTWQANSTPFVLLTLLGSSRTIPVCLTEFRESTQKNQGKFLQMLRTAYDFGKDSRGQANLTTVDYDLSSPICIDGEELIADPATQERIINIYLDVRNTKNQLAYEALNHVIDMDLHGYGATILQHTLSISDEEIYTLFKQCRDWMNKHSQEGIAQRIKDNYTVINMGLALINQLVPNSVRPQLPSNEIIIESNKLPIFDFTEVILNNVLSTSPDPSINFRRKKDKEPTVVGIHLASAYEYYRKVRHEPVPLLTLKRQIRELQGDETALFTEHNEPALTNSGKVMRLLMVNLPVASQLLDIEQSGN